VFQFSQAPVAVSKINFNLWVCLLFYNGIFCAASTNDLFFLLKVSMISDCFSFLCKPGLQKSQIWNKYLQHSLLWISLSNHALLHWVQEVLAQEFITAAHQVAH
jgi:hypothetical protein